MTQARRTRKTWADLSGAHRRMIVAGGAAEALVTALALRDLARRPSAQVRGPKALWLVGFLVQPFGPLAYFWLGRR